MCEGEALLQRRKAKKKSHLCLTEVRSAQGQMRIQNGCGEVKKPKNQQDRLKARHSGSRSQIHDLRVTELQRENRLR